MIERLILTGLITSTEYCQQIRNIWNVQFMEADSAKRLAPWVWEYFEQYNKAPGTEDIYPVFFKHVEHLPEREAKDVEGMLNDLMDEYNKNNPINLQYLLDETQKYFKQRRLTILSDTITSLITRGQVDEAEKLACDYKPVANASENDLDLSSDTALDRVDKAFQTASQPVVNYPKQLGKFWNDQLVHGGLVALMASEKRGKTFMLMDMAIRACRQGQHVVFFQAGDMTESQQLRRICVYLAQRSDQEKYCGQQWEPVRDCVLNQLGQCDEPERESNFAVFDKEYDRNKLRYDISLKNLIAVHEMEENHNYVPCHNCKAYETNHLGAVWLQRINTGDALTLKEARKEISDFFIAHKRHFKLSSHANGTLSVKQIRAMLSVWEKQDEFVPDLIVIDYADLLIGETKEFRHLQNEIWKDLRRLSQEKGQPLVVTATQADAASYERNKLTLSNFSEDKRKYSHVTAMYSLNQDTKGREKEIGILRIGELLIREGDFSVGNEVYVLQNLRRGRPVISSFF